MITTEELNGNKHYIRTNETGVIILGFSDAFEQQKDGDILIAKDAPRHFHESFLETLVNDRGQYRFKWNGEISERTEQELDEEWANRPPAPPSVEERLKATEAALLVMMEAMN